MRRLLVLISLFWAPLAAAYEETLKIPGSPELRVALGPRDVVESFGYVDSEFVIRLQLVSAFAFEALKFEPPEIENARVIRLMTPRTKAVSSFDASGYIFETAYAIFPDRAGELVIPPLVATGVIEPEPGAPQPFRAETVEQRIVIKAVPAEFHGDWWVVTPRIRVEDAWSTPPEEAQLGDVLRREVTVIAYGVEADRLPELSLLGSEGVVVSDHGGARKTSLSTEGVIGRVSRSWDIRITDPRIAVIGPVVVAHWHPVFHSSQEVGAPALRLEPPPADGGAAVQTLMAEASADRSAGQAAAAALVALLLAPLVGLAIALILAVKPTRVDRKMRRDLIAAATPEAAWKAANQWSEASGIALTGAAQNYRELSRSVFSPNPGDPPRDRVAADLMKQSRQARLAKLRFKAKGWLAMILGRTARLDDG